jgi:uroporphyrinogen-III decarboxylase
MPTKGRWTDRSVNDAAFSVREQGHVPIYAQMHDHAMFLAGVSASKFYRDPVALTEIELLVTEYYGFDLPLLMWDVYNIEAEAIGQKLRFHPHSMPDIDQSKPLVRRESDLDKVRLDRPGATGRLPQFLASMDLYQRYCGLLPIPLLCAPFSLACSIRSYLGLISDIKLRPTFAHELLQRICDDVLAPWYRELHQIFPGAACVVAADAWASPPNVSMQIFEEYVEPYVMRLERAIAPAGIHVGTIGYWGESHLKNPAAFLEAKARISEHVPLGLMCYDPDVEHLGVQIFRDVAAVHGMPLTLGIDALLLRSGTTRSITQRVRQYIRDGTQNGRLALFLNNLTVDTPPAHIFLAVAAARTLGRYPLQQDLDGLEVRAPLRESFREFVHHKQENNSEGYTFAWLDESRFAGMRGATLEDS